MRTRALPGCVRPAAFTLLELLIATAIIAAFLGGVYTTYIQVLNVNNEATARLDALRNGRAALLSMSDEIKSINHICDDGLLISPDIVPLPFGDGLDDDGDGVVDEEIVNAKNDDPSSFSLGPIANDRHAVLDALSGLRERPIGVGVADLGDADIDEDNRFGQDFIIFQIVPETPSDITLKVVTYAITDFDGQSNVLVRQTRIERTDPADPTGPPLIEGGLAPMAFGVLGFDLLFWESNEPPSVQDWLTEWRSDEKIGEKFILPAAVYVRLTLNADARPHQTLTPGAPVDTVTLATLVNIESVIGSPLFERPVLP